MGCYTPKNQFYAILLLVACVFPGCKKDHPSAEVSSIVSKYQSKINGTRMWHKQTAGYWPPAEKDTVWHYNDTSLAVSLTNSGAILFMSDELQYSSSTDSTVNFTNYREISGTTSTSNFQYNITTNTMLYTYTHHVSAGAGDWTDTYMSF